MPYRWTPAHTTDLPELAPESGAPVLRLDVWPHRSLPSKGFSIVILGMFTLGLLPVIPFIGTTAFWVLLGFVMSVLAALWLALRRSDRDHLREALLIWPDKILLDHWTEKNDLKQWEANPYWVQISVRDTKHIDNYLTLKGGHDPARTVELASFLSADERKQLHDDLAFVLGRLTQVTPR